MAGDAAGLGLSFEDEDVAHARCAQGSRCGETGRTAAHDDGIRPEDVSHEQPRGMMLPTQFA